VLASPWIRRALFVLALLAIPFPYQVIDSGRVPAAWLATVAAFIATSAVFQGGSVSATLAKWFVVQAGIAIVLAYVAAGLATAMLRRAVGVERQWTALALVAALTLGVALLPIFATTAVGGGTPKNLIGIFASR